MYDKTETQRRRLFKVSNTISLGTQKRTFLRDVPTPFVVMTVVPAVVTLRPRKKRVPYMEFVTGV